VARAKTRHGDLCHSYSKVLHDAFFAFVFGEISALANTELFELCFFFGCFCLHRSALPAYVPKPATTVVPRKAAGVQSATLAGKRPQPEINDHDGADWIDAPTPAPTPIPTPIPAASSTPASPSARPTATPQSQSQAPPCECDALGIFLHKKPG
jgi:hypothetical protein